MTLSHFFSLVDIQARMALKSDASRFFLGYIWWILEPLLYVAVFYVVFNLILGTRKENFLVFLMCGKLPFAWFSKSVSNASNSIVASAGLIGRIDIPKTLFPMSVIQEGLYKQSAVFALLFCVLMLYGYMPSLVWLWLLPVLLVNYLLIVACSLAGSVLVCFMRDFSMFISLGMIFLMFTSGVFWDPRDLGNPAVTEAVLTYNPVAFILDCYRQILMHDTMPNLSRLFSLGVIAGAGVLGMVGLMRRKSKLLALKALTA